MTKNPTTRPVLVGVDGSETASVALKWANDYAAATGSSLELLCAWSWPYTNAGFGALEFAALCDPKDEARLVLEKARADCSIPVERVTTTLVAGSAGDALIEASESASLLVVGSHGQGPLSRMLLGSVSTECVHHAHCAVVVARLPR